MKKILNASILGLLWATLTAAAPTPYSLPSDTIKQGKFGSTGDKGTIFDFGLGASNPACTIDNSTKTWTYNKNNVKIGDGTTGADKKITADTGASNKPVLIYSVTNNDWEFSNDGITFNAFGTGGGSSGVGLDFIEAQNKLAQARIQTDHVDFTQRTGFESPELQNDLFLIQAIAASDTTIYAVTNPMFARTADKNFDSTTGWTAESAATSLTTSATHKIGSTSLSFDKNSSATTAQIGGTFNQNLVSNARVFYWLNLPSTVGFANSYVMLCSDTGTTNCSSFAVTTIYGGGSFATGWNLVEVDVNGTPTSTTGTPWTSNQQVGSTHVGITTTTAGQTYSGVLLDALVFAPTDNTDILQLGDTYDVWDGTHSEEITLSTSSVDTQGLITLTGSVANNYAGGLSSFIKRTSGENLGIGRFRFVEGGSGAIDLVQNARKKTVFNSAVSSKTFNMSVTEATPLQFVVSDVTSSVQIKVFDASDNSAQFGTGDKYYVFQTFKVNGIKQYAYRNLLVTLDTNASNSGGKTTLHNSGTNAGVQIGDTIIKASVDSYLSMVATANAESFGSPLTESGVVIEGSGIPYPAIQNVVGHWHLGGADGTVNQQGILPNLSSTGTVPAGFDFLNGLFGAGPFATTGDYLFLATGPSQILCGDTTSGHPIFSLSYWIYPITSEPSGAYLVVNSTTNPGGNSWQTQIDSTLHIKAAYAGGAIIATSQAISTGAWHHVALAWNNTVSAQLYVDNVKAITSAPNHTCGPGNQFSFGNTVGSSTPAANSRLADTIAWDNYYLTDSDVTALYNAGKAILVGENPYVKHKYTIPTLTGQKSSVKVSLKRRTNAVAPSVTQFSLQKQ